MSDDNIDSVVLSTYKEVVDYLTDRDGCDDSCLFHNDCPVCLEGKLKDTCLIKRDKTFDVFFNIFLNTKQGIDNEIKASLYKMSRDAVTSGDAKEYLNNLIKVKTAFYGPEKNKEIDEITQVNIDIAPVPIEHERSNTSDIDNTNVKKRNTSKKGKQNGK